MEICLMIEGQENVTWEQWRSLALACEEHGFHGLFRSDHYQSFGHPTEWGALDAWATLSALAAVTERIRLGTLVSPVTFRHPSNLAKVAATADHVSGGRIDVGMGAGWFEGEHAAFGFPFPPTRQRFELFEEQVEIVHRLLSTDEDEVSFQGKHYRLEGCHALPKPVQRPHPPIVIGAQGGPRSVATAVRWADEYNSHSVTPEGARDLRARLDGACREAKRDPGEVRLSLMVNTVVGADRAEVEERVATLLADRDDERSPAEYLEGLGPERIAATPDRALEQLHAFAEAGVDRVMLQYLLHEDLDGVALIGRTIVPEAAGF